MSELSTVGFEILASRLHDYFIHDDYLAEAPPRLISKLLDIEAFNSVADENLLDFSTMYVKSLVNTWTSEDDNDFKDIFKEYRELFLKASKEYAVLRKLYETCFKSVKSYDQLKAVMEDAQFAISEETKDYQGIVLDVLRGIVP